MKTATIPKKSGAMIILRGVNDFRILMLKRNKKLSFASTYAFPGGKIDKEDKMIAETHMENSIKII